MPHEYYAIYTKPKAELTVEYHVTQAGCETLLPRQCFLRKGGGFRHQRKEARTIVPLFTRYLFAAGHPGAIADAIEGNGRLVRLGDEPLPIPSPVIDRIRAQLDEQGILVPPAKPEPFRVGERVRYTGQLGELLTHIVAIDNSREVKIWCDLLGGTPLAVPVHSVERLPMRQPAGGLSQKSAA